MKYITNFLLLLGALWTLPAHTQTTYVFYDQVCPMPDSVIKPPGEGSLWIGHPDDPNLVGQSFTPWTGLIDFIDLMVRGKGTFYIVLRSDSPTGPVIASTDPVAVSSLPGPPVWTRFLFPSQLRLKADVTYYFQPVTSEGGAAVSAFMGTKYTAGTAFRGTEPIEHWDVFFREGWMLVVPEIPEPSTVALALVGLPALAWAMRKRERPSLR